MKVYDRKILLEKYIEMPEEELTKMLMEPESDYKEGIFPLLLEAAKSRGLFANRDEFNEWIRKQIAIERETEKKAAEQTLSPRQRRFFTIFPGYAYWYYIFAPPGLKQRKKEAFRCQLIGLRNYLLIGLICVMVISLLSNTQISSDEILGILFFSIPLCSISVYLFFQKKKHKHNL